MTNDEIIETLERLQRLVKSGAANVDDIISDDFMEKYRALKAIDTTNERHKE